MNVRKLLSRIMIIPATPTAATLTIHLIITVPSINVLRSPPSSPDRLEWLGRLRIRRASPIQHLLHLHNVLEAPKSQQQHRTSVTTRTASHSLRIGLAVEEVDDDATGLAVGSYREMLS